jgi:hypothetical protein
MPNRSGNFWVRAHISYTWQLLGSNPVMLLLSSIKPQYPLQWRMHLRGLESPMRWRMWAPQSHAASLPLSWRWAIHPLSLLALLMSCLNPYWSVIKYLAAKQGAFAEKECSHLLFPPESSSPCVSLEALTNRHVGHWQLDSPLRLIIPDHITSLII